ncbi:DNA alkylation repair protein [Clostridia bacterium]|nr:DNA alkylation repair protein [Clostridia bacterium]
MKFKDYYDVAYAKLLAGKIKFAYPAFDAEAFVADIRGTLDNQAFSERMDLFANALDTALPENYQQSLTILYGILGDALKADSGMFSEGWWLWPVGRYVEKRGTQSVDASLAFIEALTKRFTGEFAIRPLLQHAPVAVMERMETWSRHENVHVRRLSSEGLRIRLPWAKKLYVAIEHFELYVRVLTNLKNDGSKFVQKSVANNLHDLYKEYPDKAQQIVEMWLRDAPTEATLWIVKHGTR